LRDFVPAQKRLPVTNDSHTEIATTMYFQTKSENLPGMQQRAASPRVGRACRLKMSNLLFEKSSWKKYADYQQNISKSPLMCAVLARN
jgi:hypothetical protein